MVEDHIKIAGDLAEAIIQSVIMLWDLWPFVTKDGPIRKLGSSFQRASYSVKSNLSSFQRTKFTEEKIQEF